MSGTAITEATLTSGQNEGIDRAVLPLPQMSAIVNARMRKSGRWGKRYGTATISSTTTDGTTIGNGDHCLRTIGPDFVTCDDRGYVWDSQNSGWVNPVTNAPAQRTSVTNPRVPGAVSGWQPVSSTYPVPIHGGTVQQSGNADQCYAFGCVWTVIQYDSSVTVGDEIVRIVATDQTTGNIVFQRDIYAATTGVGGVSYAHVVACGSTVVLTYLTQPLGTFSISARAITQVFGVFTMGSEVVLTTNVTTNPPVYDAAPYDSTRFVLAASTGNTTTQVSIFNASTLVPTSVGFVAPSGTNTTSVNITANSATSQIWLTALVTTVSTGGGVFVGEYTSAPALTATTTVASVSNEGFSAWGTYVSSGRLRVVYGTSVQNGICQFRVRDVLSGGGVYSTWTGLQYRCTPVSKPFSIGANAYMWVSGADVPSPANAGYATLIRLPSPTELVGSPVNVVFLLCCPIELSAQDFLTYGNPSFVMNVLPNPCLTTNGVYVCTFPVYLSTSDLQLFDSLEFRQIAASHYSEPAAYRSVNSLYADRAQFLAGGVLTRFDSRGGVEEGFCQTPYLYNFAQSVGGGLTLTTTYLYCAIYRARGANGRYEVSGTSAISSITLTGSNNQVTLTFVPLHLGAREAVTVELYRTLGNGSIFYHEATLEGSAQAAQATSGVINYTSFTTDVVLSARDILYTQVGQTLPNCFPPASAFACSGNQRVWLGGLLRPDVIHASKFVFGDQSPSWADNDAFRVVFPAPITGLAYMDNLVVFTAEGVYILAGDGPDDSGIQGSFSPPQRLPYAYGCIEPRSVVSCDDGTFYQTPRGIYMIPRGFGDPVPAGDVVLDTLAAFPIITGCAVITKLKEQSVRWSCVSGPTAASGAQLVYDLTHKTWSVDNIVDNPTGAPQQPITAMGNWVGGELALASPQVGQSYLAMRATNSTFNDSSAAISMSLTTGDLRPFGNLSEGVMTKIDLLAQLQSLCTLNITKVTEFGTSPVSQRVFAGAAGDYAAGALTYTETELGSTELRDAVSLRIQWAESSASEGLAMIAMAVEHEQGEGLKRVSPLSRTT